MERFAAYMEHSALRYRLLLCYAKDNIIRHERGDIPRASTRLCARDAAYAAAMSMRQRRDTESMMLSYERRDTRCCACYCFTAASSDSSPLRRYALRHYCRHHAAADIAASAGHTLRAMLLCHMMPCVAAADTSPSPTIARSSARFYV